MSELNETEDTCDYYAISQDDLNACSLPSWYDDFVDVTIKTKILRIPDNVLQYLRSDCMRLPLDTESSSFRESESQSGFRSSSESLASEPEDERIARSLDTMGLTRGINCLQESSSEEEEAMDEEDDRLNSTQVFQKFEEFDGTIKRAMDALDGSAFPKLNWKAPKDAMWIAFNRSLRSFFPGDIYLTLKSSTHVYNVLHEPYKECFNYNSYECDFYLCLRRWMDIDPGTEFRCFVKDSRLICISQRETSGGYEKIPAERDSIIEDIHTFFRTKIYGKFLLTHYTFDVARLRKGKVLLIDFNVFGLCTDPLLFTYREIKMMADEMDTRLKQDTECFLEDATVYGDPHFRFIGEHGTIHPVTSRKLT